MKRKISMILAMVMIVATFMPIIPVGAEPMGNYICGTCKGPLDRSLPERDEFIYYHDFSGGCYVIIKYAYACMPCWIMYPQIETYSLGCSGGQHIYINSNPIIHQDH